MFPSVKSKLYIFNKNMKKAFKGENENFYKTYYKTLDYLLRFLIYVEC